MESKIPASEVKAGDTFVHQGRKVWTAIGDAAQRGGALVIRVQFCADGGQADRTWDDPDYPLTVERATS